MADPKRQSVSNADSQLNISSDNKNAPQTTDYLIKQNIEKLNALSESLSSNELDENQQDQKYTLDSLTQNLKGYYFDLAAITLLNFRHGFSLESNIVFKHALDESHVRGWPNVFSPNIGKYLKNLKNYDFEAGSEEIGFFKQRCMQVHSVLSTVRAVEALIKPEQLVL